MPSSIDKLQNIFKLERERGFDNRAVVGGLDKLIPSWESEARQNHLDETLIVNIVGKLHSYPGCEGPQREAVIDEIMHELAGAQPQKRPQVAVNLPRPQVAPPVEASPAPPAPTLEPSTPAPEPVADLRPEPPAGITPRSPARSLAAL
nr:hypothetical protein [Anaerolinea sp.]